MKKEKVSWLTNLIYFILVPVSQIIVYIFSSKSLGEITNLLAIKEKLGLSTEQFKNFQLGLAALVSIITFLVLFIIDWLLLKLLSSRSSTQALFMSLVLGIVISNLLGIIIPNTLDLKITQGIMALIQLLIVMFTYSKLSKKYGGRHDRTGTIILGITSLALGIIPYFIH
ncbi:hypothetical protein [Xylocopilactobacillus apis]|uniref:Uncharacterized protein n=1 Tax=Xylocopilactobacillus apis TaxID=2932183 RepID=A0AAU9CSX3_9LACO|nr:hypothetical protein [Xylocopilactobacillus apis]BDR57097.1 hypothetical protein KIMC2_16590 [Xylocopilactobacillus apis]